MLITEGKQEAFNMSKKIEQAVQLVLNNSSLSIRAVYAQLELPYSKAHRVCLNVFFLFPYKIQKIQVISEANKQKRVKFAQHCLSQSDGYSEQLSKTFFSDDCMFRVNVVLNKQNVRIWSIELLMEHKPIVLNSPGAMKSVTQYSMIML